jgi:hypothetical protein
MWRIVCLLLVLFTCFSAVVVAAEEPSPPPATLEPPSPAQQILTPSPTAAERLTVLSEFEIAKRRSGTYAAGGILVAPALLFNFEDTNGDSFHVRPPIPGPWVTVGVRRPNDVSWQTSFLLVPLGRESFWLSPPRVISSIGLDVDRISTDQNDDPQIERRWQIGLRIVGIGFGPIPLPLALGPHIGLRWERWLSENVSTYGWADAAVMPNLMNAIPLVGLRGEWGIHWRSQRWPGLSITASAFQEVVGFTIAGFMTPGAKVYLGWHY